MPRILRIVIDDETTVYHAWDVEPNPPRHTSIQSPHVITLLLKSTHTNCGSTVPMSRTALDGFPLGDVETPVKSAAPR